MTPLLSPDMVARFDRDGVATAPRVIDRGLVEPLRARFDALFAGVFETGVRPDEVNWQQGVSDPSLTRQICNGWKADRLVASVVRDPAIGHALATLGGWPGARLIQDNVLWKPPGARALGFHRDNAYSRWFVPTDMITCWIALDDTTAEGGTIEMIPGSHRWPEDDRPEVAFHGPHDHLAPVSGHEAELFHVEVCAGGGSFHHGWTWHGSGPNRTERHRRALVIHAAPMDARFDPDRLHEGMGPVYGRYCAPGDNAMPEEHFPILWEAGGS